MPAEPDAQQDFTRISRIHTKLIGEQKKGGSTQSRLNLTNHHYKEPLLK